MRFTEAILRVMEDTGVTKAELARRRGVRPQSVNSMFADQRSITVERAASNARAVGYRVVLMPAGRKLPPGSFELEG